MTRFSSQVDFTSCGGFLCIAAILLMILGIVTTVVLTFQYVRRRLVKFFNLFRLLLFLGVRRSGSVGCISVTDFTFRGRSCVTLQVPWLHMLYAAIGAIVYTLVSLFHHYMNSRTEYELGFAILLKTTRDNGPYTIVCLKHADNF